MSLDITLHIDVDTGGEKPYDLTLYSGNYTHNATPMWKKAGIYNDLYESHKMKASAISDNLKKGLKHMADNPEEYKLLNPSNGWGDYKSAMIFLKEVIDACCKHPKATIRISK